MASINEPIATLTPEGWECVYCRNLQQPFRSSFLILLYRHFSFEHRIQLEYLKMEGNKIVHDPNIGPF